jgi:uncharacterized protein
MPEENAEIVRAQYAAWERQDIQSIVDTCAPDVVVVQPAEVPDSKSYRGLDGVVAAFEDWPKQWDVFRLTLGRIIDAPEDRVVSVHSQHLEARGVILDQEVAFVHTFDEGKMVRLDMFLSPEQAFAAAGLSE